MLDAVLAGRTSDRLSHGTSTAASRAGRLNVLVVDDSLSVRTVQQRLLSELDCNVFLANDGLDVLEILRSRPVDFIFSDLETPRMNGYDLTMTVRSNPNWSQLPIVIVTSRAAQKHLDRALQLGASAVITKPFTIDDLRRVLENLARPVVDAA
jgi:CheY-like chemotaxis protein